MDQKLRQVTEASALVVAGLYGVGLLIVNCDLARFGVFRLSLARPEYVLAGLLWCFWMLSLFAIEWFVKAGRPIFMFDLQSGVFAWPYIGTPLRFVVVIISFYVFSFFPLMILLRPDSPSYVWSMLLVQGVILTSWGGLVGVLNEVHQFLPEDSIFAGLAGRRKYKFHPADFVVSLLAFLVGLSFYAAYAYPDLKREFGGGSEPLAEIILKNPSTAIPWTSLGIESDQHQLVIGPVRIVLDEESGIALRAPNARNHSLWLPRVSTAIWLNRSEIGALVYGVSAPDVHDELSNGHPVSPMPSSAAATPSPIVRPSD